jgi:uncharacterized protein (DUF2267 family)
VKYDEMVAFVAGETGLARDAAEESIVATLNVLAERVSADEMRDLLAQLPKALQTRIQMPPQPTSFTLDEFIARVDRIATSDDAVSGEARVRASFAVLTQAVNAGEMRDIAAQLSEDYAELLGRPQPEAPGVAVKVLGAVGTTMSRSAGAALDAARKAVGVTSDVSVTTLGRVGNTVSRVPTIVTHRLRHAGAIGARKVEGIADAAESAADAVEDAAERAREGFDEHEHTRAG